MPTGCYWWITLHFQPHRARLRAEAIQVQILNKHRMERPPNISNPTVLATHSFNTIMENWEMQGTEPTRGHQYRFDYDNMAPDSQIAKTLISISIRHRSYAKVSDRCLVDGDPRVYVIC